MIVEALPKKLKRNHPGIIQDAKERSQAVLDEKDFVEYCIRTAEAFTVTENEMSFRAKILSAKLGIILDELISHDKIIKLDSKLLIHSNIYSDVR